MARIGKKPIIIPQSVTVSTTGNAVTVTGPKGSLTFTLRPEIKLDHANSQLTLTTTQDSRIAREIHGTSRTVIANLISGVTTGWTKTLEISGTGYRAAVTGKDLTLNLGFSHPVVVKAPDGITFETKENRITISGADKVEVGEIAARIRKLRPADPYKAKGLKYLGEVIRRKAGKAAKAAGGAAK